MGQNIPFLFSTFNILKLKLPLYLRNDKIVPTKLSGLVVRGSALSLEDRWFDSSRVKPTTLKMVPAALFLDAQHYKRIEHGQTTIGWQ